MLTGIVVALPDEISSLTHKKTRKGECIFINDNTLMCCSGAGPANAKNATKLLISKGATRFISWGCAAALHPDLSPGDLVLPLSLKPENTEQLSIDSLWLQHIISHLSNLNPNTGPLAESHTLVAQSSDKRAIHQLSNSIALDMESIAVAQIAQHHNYPVIVIRCVADPVSMDLPKAISYALNEQGDVQLNQLLWFLLTHPSELSGLIKLGIHFNAAKNKLKLVSQHLDIIVGFEQNIASK